MNTTVAEVGERKAELRRVLRAQRKGLPDRAARSAAIAGRLRALHVVSTARRVMAFRSLPGEPEMDPFLAQCRTDGATVVVPEDEPDPAWPELVVVPGVAFNRVGGRLGQGGGWYDRFLPRTRPDAVHIGVGFHFQLLDEVPCEPHDVRLHGVVTDAGTWWAAGTRAR